MAPPTSSIEGSGEAVGGARSAQHSNRLQAFLAMLPFLPASAKGTYDAVCSHKAEEREIEEKRASVEAKEAELNKVKEKLEAAEVDQENKKEEDEKEANLERREETLNNSYCDYLLRFFRKYILELTGYSYVHKFRRRLEDLALHV